MTFFFLILVGVEVLFVIYICIFLRSFLNIFKKCIWKNVVDEYNLWFLIDFEIIF